MDTSEQYIKMCEKAEEIQAGHKLTEGDWVDFWDGQGCVGHWEEGEHFHNGEAHTWLPRQDQLQEMVRRPKYSQSPVRLVHRFYDWLKSLAVEEDGETYYNNSNLNYESLEQLWLAFMMEERYNKVWNGEDWSNHAIL